jgi:hypothetical protein
MKFMSVFMVTLSALAPLASGASEPCSSHIRFVHGHAFQDSPVQVRVNGSTVQDSLGFRQVSAYQTIQYGPLKVEFVDVVSGAVLQTREFPAGPGKAYTVAYLGPARGPEGLWYANESPFVFMDDLTPPNPGRWKGTWYRLSETQVVIDFRISNGANPSQETTRLLQKPNRAAYNLGDFPAGLFQFNPVMPGSSEAFFNPALVPPRNVELTNVEIQGGELYDVFALGNFLGRAPNSLDLVGVRTRPVIDANGCIALQ